MAFSDLNEENRKCFDQAIHRFGIERSDVLDESKMEVIQLQTRGCIRFSAHPDETNVRMFVASVASFDDMKRLVDIPGQNFHQGPIWGSAQPNWLVLSEDSRLSDSRPEENQELLDAQSETVNKSV